MANTPLASSPDSGAARPHFDRMRAATVRAAIALAALAALALAAYWLHATPGRGAPASFSLLTGAALGIAFQRGRFCFFCIFRDYVEERNSGPLYAVLTALAVGGIGYAIVFGAFLPNSASGRLPPQAHIGPVSWALAAAGLAFGLGMALSGACISGHLYRLGEGYTRAPLALFGSLLGFGVGFYTWNPLYLATIAKAPIVWLPQYVGYAGALVLHLALIGLLALLLMPRLPAWEARPAIQPTLAYVRDRLLRERWNPLATGALVGSIGVFAYLRVEPIGVTAQLGSISRTVLSNSGLLPERLNGLDTFAGCATQVIQTITDNGLLLVGLIVASLAVALLGNHFQPSRLTLRNGTTALLGGVFMGWGAMTALGCTVGTLLSGISAFALSGWVFAAAVFIAVAIGIRTRLYKWAEQ